MDPTSSAEVPADAAEQTGGPVIELSAKDLPAFCPNPAMTAWSYHPRVFLDVATTGKAMCPYCGTHYRLKAGEHVSGH
ncbi:zinc-finger domain-containing protein [soil metagenome]